MRWLSPARRRRTNRIRSTLIPPTDHAALRRAAETGDIQKLRAILGAEVRIDAPDARGRRPLMLAAAGGQAERSTCCWLTA